MRANTRVCSAAVPTVKVHLRPPAEPVWRLSAEVHAADVVERWDRDIVQASTDPTPIADAGGVLSIEAGR